MARSATSPDGLEPVGRIPAQPLRRAVDGAARERLRDDEEASRPGGQQRLGVVGAVGVDEPEARRRVHLDLAASHRHPGDHDLVAVVPVVPDVADPDRAPAGRGERLDVDGLGVEGGHPHGLPGRWVDREHPAGVAGVVGGHHQRPEVDQAAGLADPRVGEGEHRVGRGGGGPRGPRGEEEADQERREGAAGHRPPSRSSTRARWGCRCQAETSSAYSSRACSDGAAPVRTARSRVLRGVCWLSTNSTTSTR